MKRLEITVPWPLGIHIHPATKIVELLQSFSADVTIGKNNEVCNARSVIQLLTLEAGYGEKIIITVKGEDEERVIAALLHFFKTYSDTRGEPKLW